MTRAQIAFALGACGGLARILMPSAMNTASKELVNWPARSLIRNLTEVARRPRSIKRLRAACVVHPVAEPDELALHPPVPPGGIVYGDADHELAYRGCPGRPSGRRRLAWSH